MEIKPNYSVLINTLNVSAIQCINTMELIQKNNDINSCLLAYQILASTSLELLGKLKLLKRFSISEPEMKILEINTYFQKLGHNLDRIFSTEHIGLEFLSISGIIIVKKIKIDNEIYSYDFILKNNKTIRTYDPESLKYWLLSKNKSNASVIAYQTKELMELCKVVQNATYNDLI